MHSAVLAVAVGILAIVAYEDVRTRRIPNALSLAIAALGLARVAFAAEVIDAGLHARRRNNHLRHHICSLSAWRDWRRRRQDPTRYSAADRLSRVARLSLFDEPLWRSARARHPRGGKARSCLSDVSGGGHTYPQPARATEVE